jgi:rfaE bifunctional protein nucleotidyltransferase chain/domain
MKSGVSRGARRCLCTEGQKNLSVVSQEALILQREEWKRNGKRVVCAAGAFDLLHPGHVRLLEQARGLGDVLVVGVETDEVVRARDGRAFPVNPAAERAEVVAAIGVVESAALMDAPLEKFLAALAPDIFVHGTEPRRASGVTAPQGTKTVAIPLEPGFSTAGLLERITTTNA